jgi:hypothetical protein
LEGEKKEKPLSSPSFGGREKGKTFILPLPLGKGEEGGGWGLSRVNN